MNWVSAGAVGTGQIRARTATHVGMFPVASASAILNLNSDHFGVVEQVKSGLQLLLRVLRVHGPD